MLFNKTCELKDGVVFIILLVNLLLIQRRTLYLLWKADHLNPGISTSEQDHERAIRPTVGLQSRPTLNSRQVYQLCSGLILLICPHISLGASICCEQEQGLLRRCEHSGNHHPTSITVTKQLTERLITKHAR